MEITRSGSKHKSSKLAKTLVILVDFMYKKRIFYQMNKILCKIIYNLTQSVISAELISPNILLINGLRIVQQNKVIIVQVYLEQSTIEGMSRMQ